METEEKIILAALKQFETYGFMAATTKSIAAEAGVAEVTLFRYFGDKKTLFIKVGEYIGGTFGLMDIRRGATGDFRRDVYQMCRGLLRRLIKRNALIRMLIFEAKKYSDIRGVLVNTRNHVMNNIRRMVESYPEFRNGACSLDCLEWLLSSLIGASLCCHMFHQTDDRNAFVQSQSGLIADAFINTLQGVKP